MDKIFNFFKQNWQYLIFVLVVLLLFWDKVKEGFQKIFNPTARDDANDNSSSNYLGGQISPNDKGIKVGADGEEYFHYGNKKVRLTSGNKAKVVDYVNTIYMYCQSNTTSLADWFWNSDLHFYTGEIQATLNDYNSWCSRQETWLHYFAYVWLDLHSVQFIDYLKCSMDAEGYDATKYYVSNLSQFYF